MQCAALPAAAITMPRRVEVGSDADVTPVEDGKDGLYSAYSEQFSVDKAEATSADILPFSMIRKSMYLHRRYFWRRHISCLLPEPRHLECVCVRVCARERE